MDDYILKKNFNIPIDEYSFSVQSQNSLESLFDFYEPISLPEMDKVQLMNRIDTKFLLSYNQLPYILDEARKHYRIVEIEGCRISPYSSIYLDTEDAEMYRMHHNRKLNRYKVRLRSYVNSGISFLEVKRKNNTGRTVKERIRIEHSKFEAICLDKDEQHFLQEKSPYSYTLLKPQLQNFFRRITFVDKKETERVTVDIDLAFKKIDSTELCEIKNLVVVEVKRDGQTRSCFRQYLNNLSINPANMSKYCLGMSLMHPHLKSNRFKQKIRLINKITKNNQDYAAN